MISFDNKVIMFQIIYISLHYHESSHIFFFIYIDMPIYLGHKALLKYAKSLIF